MLLVSIVRVAYELAIKTRLTTLLRHKVNTEQLLYTQ